MEETEKINKKFIYIYEMEKDILEEIKQKKLYSFRKEISDEIKLATEEVLELYKFNPVFKDFVSEINIKDKNLINKLDECFEILRKDHDYYMFEHKICVFIVRYGIKGINIHDNFLSVLKDDLLNLKNHVSKKNSKAISKDYIERCITKIMSVIEPLIAELRENLRYEEYLNEKEKFLEKMRGEKFYKPLCLEKLKIIKNFISREDFEKALIESNFNPSLMDFSNYIEMKRISIEKNIIERKAKEYYDMI